MRFLGQLGDDFLEVAGDVADGHVFFRELLLEAFHFGGEPFGQRAHRLDLRLFDQLALPGDHRVDGANQLGRTVAGDIEVFDDPRTKLRGCARQVGRTLEQRTLARL